MGNKVVQKIPCCAGLGEATITRPKSGGSQYRYPTMQTCLPRSGASAASTPETIQNPDPMGCPRGVYVHGPRGGPRTAADTNPTFQECSGRGKCETKSTGQPRCLCDGDYSGIACQLYVGRA